MLQKEFGRYRTVAHREAVIITNYGCDDLALIFAEECKLPSSTRLKSL